MLAFRLTVFVLVFIALSSCAYTPGGKSFPWEINFSGGTCKDVSPHFLEGVDWYKAKVLDIRIRQGRFSPTYLGLYTDEPYILSIENADDVDHTFQAFDFFRAIAVAGVSADGEDFKEIKCMAGVTISPRTKTALRFVAVRDGTYEFEDNSIVNSLAMIGSGGGFITVEPQRKIIESPAQHTSFFDYKPIMIKTESARENGTDSSGDLVLAPNPEHRELLKNSTKDPEDQPLSATEYPESQQPMDKAPSQSVAISPSTETLPSKEVVASPSQTPITDQGAETPLALEVESRKKIVNEQKVEIKESPASTDTNREIFASPSRAPINNQGLKTPLATAVEERKELVNEQKVEIENATTATETNKDLMQHVVPEAIPRGQQVIKGPPADVYSDPPDGGEIRINSSDAAGDGRKDKFG